MSRNEPIYEALNAIGYEALRIAREKGFNTEERGAEIDQKLLLIVSEIVEAQDELRDGHAPTDIYFSGGGADNDGVVYPATKPEGFGIELADAIIRIVQLACSQGVDIGAAVRLKMAYNEGRPYKHGRQF